MINKTVKHYPVPNKPELQQKIVELVNDRSGGMKFTELISELSADTNFLREEYASDTERFLHDVEWYCRNTESLKVLDYTWKSMNRAKMFVYSCNR